MARWEPATTVLMYGNPAFPQELSADMVVVKTSTSLVLDYGEGRQARFTGFGVSYDSSNRPIAGTITKIEGLNLGVVTSTISELNLGAADYFNFLVTGGMSPVFAADDTIILFGGDNRVHANGGNDTVFGAGRNDTLLGESGHDYLYGGAGDDELYGNDGNDHLFGQSANGGVDGNDLLVGNGGDDYLQGNAGMDQLSGGDGADRINGGADNDRIRGDDGNDSVNGNRGADSIEGGNGDDLLRGGQDADTINGGAGNDTLMGDLGADALTGGEGADIFAFSGAGSPAGDGDRITDFANGIDHLSIGYRPTEILTGVVQADFAAARALAEQLFANHAGNSEVAAIGVGADSYIFYASAGGATPDSAILLTGIPAGQIDISDFV